MLGAVKDASLKTRIGGDIIYDPKESIALEGHSVRTCSTPMPVLAVLLRRLLSRRFRRPMTYNLMSDRWRGR